MIQFSKFKREVSVNAERFFCVRVKASHLKKKNEPWFYGRTEEERRVVSLFFFLPLLFSRKVNNANLIASVWIVIKAFD